MSKERARRRAQREATAAVAHEKRSRETERRHRREAFLARILPSSRGRSSRSGGAGGGAGARTGGGAGGGAGRGRSRGRARPSALARHRSRQDGVLLAALVVLHAILWLLEPSWWWRGGALIATLLLWPVIVVLAFDRRPSA